MNKKMLAVSFAVLLLAACGNSNTNEEDIETTEAEKVEIKNESRYISMDDEKLNGSYLFTSDDRRSNVTFEDGIIRFSDGEGNLSYRLANNGDRLVISEEEPQVYLFLENVNGLELVNINNNGETTNSNIILESK